MAAVPTILRVLLIAVAAILPGGSLILLAAFLPKLLRGNRRLSAVPAPSRSVPPAP